MFVVLDILKLVAAQISGIRTLFFNLYQIFQEQVLRIRVSEI